MIVVTTGSSKWTDYKLVWEVLDEIYEEVTKKQANMTPNQRSRFPKEYGMTIYNGEAESGVDYFVRQWFAQAQTEAKEVHWLGFPADWDNCSSICPPRFAPAYQKHRRKGRHGDYCASAGIARNIEMVNYAEAHKHQHCFSVICLAWCLNDSPGTIQCARLAKRRGFDVRPHRLGTKAKRI